MIGFTITIVVCIIALLILFGRFVYMCTVDREEGIASVILQSAILLSVIALMIFSIQGLYLQGAKDYKHGKITITEKNSKHTLRLQTN